MLTLDRVMLFYHSLRQASQEKRKNDRDNEDDEDAVRDWSNNVKQASKLNKRTTTLADNSQKTVSTMKTKFSTSCLALNANIGIKCADKGLLSQSEVDGEEREAAHSSPIKPKKTRAMSQVCLLLASSPG